MIYLYWIKRNTHTDIFTEGYVGVSAYPMRRFLKEHSKSKARVGKAIRKYSDVQMTIVDSYETLEEALKREEELRPTEYIGWNIIPGGSVPPRNHLTEEVRQKISHKTKLNGTVPYCEKTHSPESLAKSIETKRQKQYKWIHNPSTGDYTQLSYTESGGQLPEGYEWGRVVKTPPKVRGVDYNCNTKTWEVVTPDGKVVTVFNLKKWCNENDLNYNTVYNRNKGYTVRLL
jgi:predicted GIY-YIG superfamily endonuclease